MSNTNYLEFLLARDNVKQRKRPGDEEHRLQCGCVRWFRLQHADIGSLLFAVPNGGRRDKASGARLKAEGVVAGVSDLILLVARHGHHGLLIEMKTPKGSQSQQQRQWQKLAEKQGYRYVVIRSIEEFIQVVNEYLADE